MKVVSLATPGRESPQGNESPIRYNRSDPTTGIPEGGVKTIAYLTPLYFGDESYVGGGERYPLNMAIGVAESSDGEFEVELLSYGPKSLRRQLHPGVRLRVMKADYTPPNPLDTVSWELLDALGSADLIHLQQSYTRGSEVGIVLGKVLGKPVCATDHGGPSSQLGLQFKSLDLVDRVICQSTFAAEMTRTKTPIVTIKGGVDGRQFSPPVPRPRRDRVLCVARLLPHKGIDRLIEALPPDIPLTCCGRPYHGDYFRHLQRLAADKQVEFITDASDAVIRELYGRAWANVLPSQYKDCYGQTYLAPELMGLTLLEGMASGTPVICSRVGAMPEFVRHGETGFVFDTVPQLTEQLKLLASDPALCDRMGAKARRAVDTEFDLRVCGAKLIEVYRELLAVAPAARGRVAA